jgi:hypothetical protein
MADKKVLVKKRVRAEKYEEKVKFKGNLKEMIKVTGNTQVRKEDKASK